MAARQRWLLLGALLAAWVVRLYRLGAESLWYDEAVSVMLARKPLAEMIAHTAGDIHPPGYYALLHGWDLLLRPTLVHGLEFLYAVPSVFFGMLMVALAYALTRRLFDGDAALAVAWLMAINPFEAAFSQEVRMYTFGGALGLLCLWGLTGLEAKSTASRRRHLALYVLAAAAGLYTLYYFAFLLIGLNAAAFALLAVDRQEPGSRRARRLDWVGAQALAALLFVPWLPVFWRQATEPPVPPWREPWDNLSANIQRMVEGVASLLDGRLPGSSLAWAPALAVAAIFVAFWLLAPRPWRGRTLRHRWLLTLALVTPVALIFALSWLVTPLYHVRYFFIYSPAWLMMAGVVVADLGRRHRWAGAALFALLAVASAVGLNLHFNAPANRVDDHRAAVATLAANWQPGDIILANAGYLYPLLELYWPTEPAHAGDALPPPLAGRIRAGELPLTGPETALPLIVQTGSIDGAASLGWGSPTSDFFSWPAVDATRQIETLLTHANRVWHYRQFDTVTDPDGLLRNVLASHATLDQEWPSGGRDFLLLQLWRTARSSMSEPPLPSVTADFDDSLHLHGVGVGEAQAGRILYIETDWAADQPAALGSLAVSLRLYDQKGGLLAQQDRPFVPAAADWPPGVTMRQRFSLPLPASLPPGPATLEMVVYNAADGVPLAVTAGETTDGRRLSLAPIDIQPASGTLPVTPVLATFDYLELASAVQDRTEAMAGEVLTVQLLWRPAPSGYSDTYRAIITLVDPAGNATASIQGTLGGDAYPSGDWPAGWPVSDRHTLPLPADLAAGAYSVQLTVERAGDSLPIPAKQGWRSTDQIMVGTLVVH